MSSFDNETVKALWIFYAVERNKVRVDLGPISVVSDLESEMEALRRVAEKVWDEKSEHQSVHGENPYRAEPPTKIEAVLSALDELNEALQGLPNPYFAVSLVLDTRSGVLRDVMRVPVPSQEKK